MRKEHKIFIVVLLLAIITGGYFMHQAKIKDQEHAFWGKQKPRIEKFYKYNYKDVHSVDFGKTYILPTKTHVIEGYINGDKSLSFSSSVDPGTDFEAQGTGSAALEEHIKEEYQFQSKTVSQIEKEEKEKRSKTSQE